jgi:hypothetical protein
LRIPVPGRSLRLIDLEQDMQMIMHHRAGADTDGKGFGQCHQPLFDTSAPTFERPASHESITAEKGASNAVAGAMAVGHGFGTDEGVTRSWHDAILRLVIKPKFHHGGRDANMWVSNL